MESTLASGRGQSSAAVCGCWDRCGCTESGSQQHEESNHVWRIAGATDPMVYDGKGEMDVDRCAVALVARLKTLADAGMSVRNWQYVARVFGSVGDHILSSTDKTVGGRPVDQMAWWQVWRTLSAPGVNSADDLIERLTERRGDAIHGSDVFASRETGMTLQKLCTVDPRVGEGEIVPFPCSTSFECFVKYLSLGWDLEYGKCELDPAHEIELCICKAQKVPWLGLVILVALAIVTGPIVGRVAISVARWIVQRLGERIVIPITP